MINQHHYNPTLEQREELRAAAAKLKTQVALRRLLLDSRRFKPEATRQAEAAAEFKALGWSDSAAGELAEIQIRVPMVQA